MTNVRVASGKGVHFWHPNVLNLIIVRVGSAIEHGAYALHQQTVPMLSRLPKMCDTARLQLWHGFSRGTRGITASMVVTPHQGNTTLSCSRSSIDDLKQICP